MSPTVTATPLGSILAAQSRPSIEAPNAVSETTATDASSTTTSSSALPDTEAPTTPDTPIVEFEPQEVTAYTLQAGQLQAVVWDYGAHLVELQAPDRRGERTNVVMPRGTVDVYASNPADPSDRAGYVGATVGRYANRIAAGRFSLDGVAYELATNNGANHLHGGMIGFDQYVWTAETFTTDTSAGIHLRHTSPAGDEGYPGTLEVEVTYTLDVENKLTMAYSATTDAPTVVNLTNHAYWNLAGGGSINRHLLRLGAAHYLPVDETQIPLGGPEPVAGSRFDLRKPKMIDVADGGLDHCFVLDMALPAAELVHPTSGRRMTVETDQPGVQVYTANHLDPPHTAVCLETQRFPDAPNHADWDAVLRPGETYSQRTVHTFGTIS